MVSLTGIGRFTPPTCARSFDWAQSTIRFGPLVWNRWGSSPSPPERRYEPLTLLSCIESRSWPSQASRSGSRCTEDRLVCAVREDPRSFNRSGVPSIAARSRPRRRPPIERSMGRWFRRPGSPVGHILGRMQAVDPLERRSIVRFSHRGVDREPPVRPFGAFCTHVQRATEGLVSAMRSSLVHARWRGARGCASKRPRPETTTSATKKDAWARPRAVHPPQRGTVVPVRQRVSRRFWPWFTCLPPPACARRNERDANVGCDDAHG